MAERLITGKAHLMKEINKNLILRVIRDQEPISRSDIAERTHLALPTVMRIVNDLIEDDFLIEVGKGDSNGGRKPILLQINEKAAYIIGVGVSHRLTVILTDLKGNIVERFTELTLTKYGPEGILKQVTDIIHILLQRNNIPLDKVMGIGIGTPGTNFKTGRRINTSVFKGWENIDIKEAADKDISMPVPMFVENVAKAGAMGELWFGKGHGVRDFIFIYADYGTGSGIVIDGNLYRGRDGMAGELGHMVVDKDGEECYCGNRGCLETEAAIPAIMERVRAGMNSQDARILRGLMKDRACPLTLQLIEEAAEKGDMLCGNVLRHAGEMLAIGVANLINIFNPEMVIIGGEIGRTCGIIIDVIRNKVPENVFMRCAQDTPIVVSDAQDDTSAMGAMALVMQNIFGSVL